MYHAETVGHPLGVMGRRGTLTHRPLIHLVAIMAGMVRCRLRKHTAMQQKWGDQALQALRDISKTILGIWVDFLYNSSKETQIKGSDTAQYACRTI